jgi:DNA-binding GntR family transcriptional regulator
VTLLAQHRTKTELALQVVRDLIRTGSLAPGQRLHLDSLTTDLGMSRTPIREALRLLQADGLVVYRPHQGIVVAEFSARQTEEIVRLRCLLEPLAVELAVPELTAKQLRELRRLHERLLAAVATGRGTTVTASNASWHWRIYEASGSSLLTEFIRRLWDVYPWRTMWVLPGRLEQSATEHEAIMQAIAEGDAALAAERVREHILSSRQTLLDRLELEQADAGDSVPKEVAAS